MSSDDEIDIINDENDWTANHSHIHTDIKEYGSSTTTKARVTPVLDTKEDDLLIDEDIEKKKDDRPKKKQKAEKKPGKKRWTTAEEIELLENFEERMPRFKDAKTSHATLWDEIIDATSSTRSREQMKSKLSSLKARYRDQIRLPSGSSSAGLIEKGLFRVMDRLWRDCPNVVPPSIKRSTSQESSSAERPGKKMKGSRNAILEKMSKTDDAIVTLLNNSFELKAKLIDRLFPSQPSTPAFRPLQVITTGTTTLLTNMDR